LRVLYKRRFLKQLAQLPAGRRDDVERFVLETLPAAKSLETTGAMERMQGYKGFCKVRFGAYRVGLRADGPGHVEVTVVAHRREIYGLFR
jgi:mRNA interferase RelE/StbE